MTTETTGAATAAPLTSLAEILATSVPSALDALYLRVSQDRANDELAVVRHYHAIVERAAREGVTEFRICADNDVSASTRSTKKRPDYNRMMKDAETGRVRSIWAYSMSRLTRRPVESEDILRLAERGAVNVRTVASGELDLTRTDGRMAWRMIMAADAAEAERISERVALRAKQRAESGGNIGGQRRFGYTPNAKELVPAEADALRWAYAQIIAGASLRSVTAEMTARGLTGTLGKPLRPPHVRTILLRPHNAGFSVYRGKVIGRTAMPVIVEEETWREACAILSDPARRIDVGRPVNALLAGIATCGTCGAPCYTRARNGSVVGPFYACQAGHHTKRQADVDRLISGLVLAYCDANREALRAPVETDGPTAVDEAAALRERLARWERLAESGDIDPEDYVARTRPLRAQLAAVDARVREEAFRPATAALLAAEDMRAAWDGVLTRDQKRAVVRELLASIVVMPGRQGSPRFDPETIVTAWRPIATRTK